MKKQLQKVFRWLKNLFTKNMGMKIGAIVFAFLLWSFVLAEQNPPKEKIFNNIHVSYATSDALRSRGLTSVDPFSEILGSVSVTVEAAADRLSDITEQMITAEVDLSDITEPGEYTRPVKANSLINAASVVKVSPSEVSFEIEELVMQEIPLEINLVGEKQEGLYYGEPVVEKKTIEIEGARSNVEKVTKAVCEIDISEMTRPTTEMFSVQLVGSNGEEESTDRFTTIPSVIVEVPVYAKKEVTVDTAGILENLVGVAQGYEISSVTASPNVIEIAGNEEALGDIRSITLEPIVLEDATTDQIVQAKVSLPRGLYAAVPDEVQVTLTIVPEQSEITYSAVDIAVKNAGEDQTVTLQPEAIDIVVAGTIEQLDAFTADLLHPFVDVEGLRPGTHTLEIKFENEPDLGVTLRPSVTEIRVTIE